MEGIFKWGRAGLSPLADLSKCQETSFLSVNDTELMSLPSSPVVLLQRLGRSVRGDSYHNVNHTSNNEWHIGASQLSSTKIKFVVYLIHLDVFVSIRIEFLWNRVT